MIRSYALQGLVVVLGGTILLWPWLDAGGRRGVAVAGATAYGVQLLAVWLLVRFRDEVRPFILAWAGGMVLRLAALAGLVALVMAGEVLPPAATLLGLVGFLFALLVAEFFHLGAHARSGSTKETGRE